ncbi:RmlC-like cupin domain-containing protein [Halenospora varia]|nr:RmlC-like cupin domain-containing protein [Halenospora varia]
MLATTFITLLSLPLLSLAAPAPAQEPLTALDSPQFPIPQPLPYNATIPGVDYAFITRLKTAPNLVARVAMGATLEGEGGKFVVASGATMLGLVENGMSMAVGFTKACGFNTPHTHPRATELSIVVKGRMISEFVAETGARKIRNEHQTYSMAAFPQGALHLEFNPDCEELVFVAIFNSEDPGINTPAESLFMLDDDFSGLALGLEFLPGADIDKFRHLVPATLAQGVETCLTRCGITKNDVKGKEDL